jgi:hypothetical protein
MLLHLHWRERQSVASKSRLPQWRRDVETLRHKQNSVLAAGRPREEEMHEAVTAWIAALLAAVLILTPTTGSAWSSSR